jgi:hypothetical protein
MRLGMYSGDSAPAPGQALLDSSQYLCATTLQSQLMFLDSTISWAGGMANSFYIGLCANSTKAVMSVPMLVGPSTGSPLTGSGTGQTTSPSGPTQGLFPGTPIPTTMTLADVGAGVWDALFTQVFEAVAGTRPDCILRLGWEMYGNGGFYPWSGPALASQYRAAWIDLVNCARAVSSSFQFDWNGGVGYNGYSPITGGAWPGASYVDFITADVYENQGGSLNGAANWAVIAASLAPGLSFAQSQGKPFCIPEFGLWPASGSLWGDDPAWIQAAYAWMRANQNALGYVLYFNDPASAHDLNENPDSAAAFTASFGAWGRQLAGLPGRFMTVAGVRSRYDG